MKKILAVLVLVLFGTMTYAQWSTNGASIYNTATGRLGINISAPTELMHIYTAGSVSGADGRAVYLATSGYSGTAFKNSWRVSGKRQ